MCLALAGRLCGKAVNTELVNCQLAVLLARGCAQAAGVLHAVACLRCDCQLRLPSAGVSSRNKRTLAWRQPPLKRLSWPLRRLCSWSGRRR